MPTKPHPLLAGSIALGAAVALLTGCGSTDTPQENEAQVCAATKAYASALTSFKDALTPTSTVDQVRTAREEVAKTHNDLLDASEDVAKDRVDAVKEAEQSLDRAVKDVPDDATLAQARASLRDEAVKVQAALSDLGTAASC
jgi:flagellar hook-basal body complex protein FliE